MTTGKTTHDDAPAQNTFKDQLDKAAIEQREREQCSKPNPIVEKSMPPRRVPTSLALSHRGWPSSSRHQLILPVTEIIPAASKVLGPKEHHNQEAHPPGPPERPDHDPSIETFVRDQHKSMPRGIEGDLTSADRE
ncbi:hypothetical protein EsDP_00007473 [Epichloe bromicola]|uniref:RPEL repeat protein n=1 Tax=Epichloe bromicola TaxID=79588 RepID=A0ABQ0D0M3_9HYPO